MIMEIIDRIEECKKLKRLYQSEESEFFALFGRRRVGKTFLIRQFFKEKGFFFEITGSPDASTEEQILNFHDEFCGFFNTSDHVKPPKNWSEAFKRLRLALKTIQQEQKMILFIDELPWLATPHSRFYQALDYNWNRHFSTMSNLVLIVAGSSASWMLSEIINAKGGLHNRLTGHLRLEPFKLAETAEYLASRNIKLPKEQISELYMITGGVPKYLSYLEDGGKSVAQHIHSLCFTPHSPLLTEYYRLYRSLFQKPEQHFALVQALANKRHGMLREELLREAKLSDSGRTNEVINELVESGFLMLVPEIGKKIRNSRYYLCDEFSLFYLNWIEPRKGELLQGLEPDFWLKCQASQKYRIWAGYAFELICLKAVDKIKQALGIGAVFATSGYWQSFDKGKKEAEVDIVIDRADGCINLCEVKFHNSLYEMNQSDAEELRRKKEIFIARTKTRKAVFTTLITKYGAVVNPAYLSIVDNQVTLSQLF